MCLLNVKNNKNITTRREIFEFKRLMCQIMATNKMQTNQ